MKSKKIVCLFILSSLANLSCRKEPEANFTTDKESYIAGETVHCTDASKDAHTWFWKTPDGVTATTRNFDYKIDSDYIEETKSISLQVGSKKDKKSDKISKSIKVVERILPSDYFAVGSDVSIPLRKRAGPVSNQFWRIEANNSVYNAGPHAYMNSIYINFSGTIPPVQGIYELQASTTTLTSGKANVVLYNGDSEQFLSWISTSGQLIVTKTANGKIRISFANCDAMQGLDTTIYKLSGDITCH